MLDPVAVERAEKSIDEFINSRSKAREKANEEEALYTASVRRHREKRREEHKIAWHSYHDHMSQNFTLLYRRSTGRRLRGFSSREKGQRSNEPPKPPRSP